MEPNPPLRRLGHPTCDDQRANGPCSLDSSLVRLAGRGAGTCAGNSRLSFQAFSRGNLITTMQIYPFLHACCSPSAGRTSFDTHAGPQHPDRAQLRSQFGRCVRCLSKPASLRWPMYYASVDLGLQGRALRGTSLPQTHRPLGFSCAQNCQPPWHEAWGICPVYSTEAFDEMGSGPAVDRDSLGGAGHRVSWC